MTSILCSPFCVYINYTRLLNYEMVQCLTTRGSGSKSEIFREIFLKALLQLLEIPFGRDTWHVCIPMHGAVSALS